MRRRLDLASSLFTAPRVPFLIVAGSVQLSVEDKVIRVHPIRPARPRELGTLANPKAGRAAATRPPDRTRGPLVLRRGTMCRCSE